MELQEPSSLVDASPHQSLSAADHTVAHAICEQTRRSQIALPPVSARNSAPRKLRTKQSLGRELTRVYIRMKGAALAATLSTQSARLSSHVGTSLGPELPSKLQNGNVGFFTSLREPFRVHKATHVGDNIFEVGWSCDLDYTTEHTWGWMKNACGTFNNQMCGCASVRIPPGFPAADIDVLDWGVPSLWGFTPRDDWVAPSPSRDDPGSGRDVGTGSLSARVHLFDRHLAINDTGYRVLSVSGGVPRKRQQQKSSRLITSHTDCRRMGTRMAWPLIFP
mmetsp:Transcript_5458/g.13041  ORF Transcript_5458/g.13041 Transcript_5458/m.13041 type:complete len:278 (+) Transcript_5458:18-851(+)